ncbi:MAG: CvpA family protein [Limisphaerales bacterium]
MLLASGFGLGLRLGSIASAFSFVAIIIAYLFAHLVGKLFRPLLAHVFATSPLAAWAVPPIIGFLIVYALIVAIGLEVQRRVGVYYKYKAGDLHRGLWERLDNRLGGCVGILNGTAWLILVSFVFFNWSYWTAQIAPSQNEPKTIRLVNNLGHGLQNTGFDKVGRAVGSIPDSFYRMADFAGLLVQNPRLMARLGDYPAFISLTERPEIQSLGQDSGLIQAWNSRAPLGQILNDDQIQSIIKDTNVSATIWNTVRTNMDDITNYLISGKSPKFASEKIIGRWQFDVVPALGALLEAQPKIRPNELKAIRALWDKAFAQTTFAAGSDGQAFLKNVPDFRTSPPASDTWTGQWLQDGANYELTLNANNRSKVAIAQTDGLRLTVKMGDDTLVFQRAD